MYIVNPGEVKNKIGFKKIISEYLQENGVPLLAIEGDSYYFANTELLKSALKNAPLWVKITTWFTQ